MLLTAASMIGMGFVSDQVTRRKLSEQIETRLLLQARNLALSSSAALLGDYPELTLHPLTREMLEQETDPVLAVVVDHQGRMRGHPDARSIGKKWQRPEGLKALTSGASVASGEKLLTSSDLFMAEASVADQRGRPIGRAIVSMPAHYLDDLLATSRRQLSFLLGAGVFVSVVSTLMLISHLLRPIAILRTGIERIGRGDLDFLIRLRDGTELGLLADTLNEMTRALKKAQSEMLERERLAHEIDLARRLQQSLLPSSPLRAGDFLVRGSQRAAAEVGGDYYDFLPLSDGRIAVTIADVVGKGLEGCLVMTMLSALMRAFRNTDSGPAALLSGLDERLGEMLEPGAFVTMFYGILDPKKGELTFASAGHNPLLLYRRRSGQVERIRSTGIPLGAVRGGAARRTYRDQRLELEPGDVLVQYTDGFTEAMDGGRYQFGIDRMAEVVGRNGKDGGGAVVKALEEAVHAWTANVPYDDETLLVVEHTGEQLQVQRSPTHNLAIGLAIGTLGAAMRDGHRLDLPAHVESLSILLEWIRRTPILDDLAGDDANLLATALYEACANVAEHGFGNDPTRCFSLWWVPPEAMNTDAPGTAVPGTLVRAGRFVILDQGRAFQPDGWQKTDFNDTGVWKRCRGFGLDIIYRAMREVNYCPGTQHGNITVLQYGPSETIAEKAS
jgi:serine phosphatase RsbU (regulator of sigma subunit)